MPRRLPSLNGLKAFEAAARHESFTRAAQELERAMELCPGQPDLANDLATHWLRRSVPAKAEAVLRQALAVIEGDAGLHLNLALALTLLGRKREALSHAEAAAAAEDADIAEQGARLREQLRRGKAA